MKDYLRKKEDNKLTTLKISKALNVGTQKCALSYSPDGLLKFGYKIMLNNPLNNVFLACDTSDIVADTNESFGVSGTNCSEITNRSVFTIRKFVDEKSPYNDNIVRYGQKICLEAHSKMFQKKLFLRAYPYSQIHFAKLSKKMEISVTSKIADYSTIWEIEHPDIKLRFQSVGTPVEADKDILLKNCSIGHWLACDSANKFGNEFEVFLHSFNFLFKSRILNAETVGNITRDKPMKSQGVENIWRFMTANDELLDYDDMAIETHTSPEAVILEFKRKLKSKGNYSLLGLEKTFALIDIDQSGVIEYEEFREALKIFRIFLNEKETNDVFRVFDDNNNGVIELNEFLARMKGAVNEKRKALIISAYKKLFSQIAPSPLTIDILKLSFNPAGHPEVKSSKRTAKDIEIEFSNYWGNGNTIVSQEHFFNHYEVINISKPQSLSAMIDSDEYFRNMMVGCWRME